MSHLTSTKLVGFSQQSIIDFCDLIQDPIVLKNINLEILFANKCAIQFFGSFSIIKDLCATIPPSKKQSLDAQTQFVFSTKEPREMELTFDTNGQQRTFLVKSSLLPIASDEPLVLERIIDITKYYKEKEVLKKSNDYLRQALDLNATAIFARDEKGRFTFANETFANFYNTSVDQLIGKTDADFNPNKEQVKASGKSDAEVFRSRKALQILEEPLTNDKEEFKWLNTLKIPILDEDGNPKEVMGVSVDITEQKINQLAREESEIRLRAVLNSSLDRIWAVNLDRELIFFNNDWEEQLVDVYGIRPRKGDKFPDIIQPDSGESLPDPYEAVFNGQIIQGDWLCEKLNGQKEDISFTLNPIKDLEGKIIGAAGFAKNVTSLLSAEKKVKQTVSGLAATLESTTDAILVMGKDSKATHYNKKMAEMWDLPISLLEEGDQSKLLEKAKELLLDPDEFMVGVRKVYANESANSYDVLKFKDGRIIERFSIPQYIDDEIVGRVLSFKDITEKVKAEGQLRKNVDFLETLIEAIPHPVFSKNRDLKFVMCNTAFADLLELDKEEILGREVAEIQSRHLDDICEHIDEVLIKKGGLHTRAFNMPKKLDKFREIIIQKQTFLDINGEIDGILGVITDITEIKEAQNELQIKNEELQRYIDSNLQLENFAYFASHDLKEPLRTIGNFTQLLDRRYSHQLEDKAKDYMNFVVEGAQTMNRLIDDLLTYSRVNSQKSDFEELNISRLLDSVNYNLKQAIEESQATIEKINIPEKIIACKTKLFQLFLNLIANALKFKKENQAPLIQIECKEEKEEWLFSVKDNGIGIDPEYHDKIFVLFRKLHGRTKYDGTGIGLALCKKIVEQHDGKIWVESEENKGTTFYFTLKKQQETV